MAHIKIFLSTVSAEFRSYREALCHDLNRPNVTVKVQEDFIATDTETLDKLDEYIRQCEAESTSGRPDWSVGEYHCGDRDPATLPRFR